MFYWQVYKALNPDLVFETEEDYLKHYFEKGQLEKRKYKIEHFSFYFRSFIYKHNYLDLREKSIGDLQAHWITIGFYEGRISDRLIEPIETIDKRTLEPGVFDFVEKVIFINLESRKDRLGEILEELKWANIPSEKIVRFNAFKHEKGYIGCAISHIKCLEYAIENNLKNIMILEDDFTFKRNKTYIENSVRNLNSFKNWDVILLASNFRRINRTHSLVNGNLFRVFEGLTTAGYIIKRDYYRVLLENFREALINLLKTGRKEEYSIDVNWKKLQEKDQWYMFFPTFGYQKISYSDIENFVTNYGDII